MSHQWIKYQMDLDTYGSTILFGHTGEFTVVMGSFIQKWQLISSGEKERK